MTTQNKTKCCIGCKIIISTMLFILFLGLYVRFLVTVVDDDDEFCKLKYNASGRGSDEIFGKYCAIVNYENKTVVKYYYNFTEMKDYCGEIRFWDITKFKDNCYDNTR